MRVERCAMIDEGCRVPVMNVNCLGVGGGWDGVGVMESLETRNRGQNGRIHDPPPIKFYVLHAF